MRDPDLQRIFDAAVAADADDLDVFVAQTMQRVDAARRRSYRRRIASLCGGVVGLALLLGNLPQHGFVVSLEQPLRTFDQALSMPISWLFGVLVPLVALALRRDGLLLRW